MSDFDDRSGIVECPTQWGRWWQTIDEVYIEINVPQGTTSKYITCDIKTNSIKLCLKGNCIITGDFPKPVKADDAIWTLEDRNLVRICLLKTHATAGDCWKSLVKGQYEADPITVDEMEKKLTLQKFQIENPGFDFSGASMSGNYHGGGPNLPAS